MKNREETARQFFDTGISANSSPFLQEEDKDFDELYDKVKCNSIYHFYIGCRHLTSWSVSLAVSSSFFSD